MVRKIGDSLVRHSGNFAGVDKPVESGRNDKVSPKQYGGQYQETQTAACVNRSSSFITAKVVEVGDNYGPTPKPSEPA